MQIPFLSRCARLLPVPESWIRQTESKVYSKVSHLRRPGRGGGGEEGEVLLALYRL